MKRGRPMTSSYYELLGVDKKADDAALATFAKLANLDALTPC